MDKQYRQKNFGLLLLFLGLLCLLSPVRIVQAQANIVIPYPLSLFVDQQMVEMLANSGWLLSKPEATQDGLIRRRFYEGLNKSYSGEYGEASKVFAALKVTADRQGYVNLPDFSFELINRAKVAREEADLEKVRFYLMHAMQLSPEDPRVSFAVASFREIVGLRGTVRYLLRSFASLPKHRIVLATVLLNVVFVGLVAITLALFIVCLLQLIQNGERVYSGLTRVVSTSKRGFYMALLYPCLLVLPLFLGILGALMVWSLLLAVSQKSCRLMCVVTSLVLIAWGLAIPKINTLGYNMERRVFQVVSDVNNFSYTPEGEDFIVRELERSPGDKLLLFALGEMYQLKGLPGQALEQYQKVVEQTSASSPLHGAARMNMGVLHFNRKDYSGADAIFSELDKSGFSSFELYYNLALVRLARLDTSSHKRYLAAAKQLVPETTVFSELIAQGNDVALMTRVPPRFYFPLLNRKIERYGRELAVAMHQKQRTLAAAMLIKGTPDIITMTGAGMLLCSLFLFSRKRRSSAILHEPEETPAASRSQLVWAAIPGGLFATGTKPTIGAMLIAICLCALMLGMQAPISPFGLLPVAVDFGNLGLKIAISLVALGLLIPLLFRPRAVA